eukprot:scaffold1318_cov388-Prasinococcus_capsulatus_cf.AAC.47
MVAFSRFMVLAAAVAPATAAVYDCKMCFDAGYEQGQMDCEPDTTGAVTSDPHVSGFNKQSFDFTGEAGKFYALISDESMAVNARFGAAYTTGVSVDPDTLVTSLMREQGTVRSAACLPPAKEQATRWLTAAAIILGKDIVTASIAKSSLESFCPTNNRLEACFYGGSIQINGEDVIRTGIYPTDNEVSVEVSNQNSFGRINIHAMKKWRFDASLDYVPAPAAWQLEAEEAAELAHINFKINKIALSSVAHGVIGQTSRVKYDENGMPVLAAEDKNGAGVIDGEASDYELDSLTSTDFKFSVFGDSDLALDGFAENKLNAAANKFNV